MRKKHSSKTGARLWPTMTAGKGATHRLRHPSDIKRNGVGRLEDVVSLSSIPTSAISTEPPTSESPLLPGAFLASHFPAPGSAEAREMTARSGRKCCVLLRRQDPLGSWLRTFLESSAWNSTMCFLTWKAKATPRGRLYCQLAPSMPHTDGIGSGLWPTPRASERSQLNSADNKRDVPNPRGLKLKTAVKMWSTPTKRDAGSLLHCTRGAGSLARKNEIIQPLPVQVDGILNPVWVEWLMGYPPGWTELPAGPKKTRISRVSPPASQTMSNA